VEVTTLSRDGTTELERGTLTLIDNQIDPGTGTVKLKATYANANDKLWPGQYVNARVLVRTDRNVLVVPTTSIQIGPSGPFTYVVRADSSVESRPLTISEESGGMTVVKAGLSLNERVVTSNQYRLQPGDHIRTEAAQPSPAGNKSGPKSP
jgi:multidrug efflux system membrane fusion protein